jgi:hypothetical protein
MTAAVPFPLPPGRILSSWRRELAAFRPGRLRLVHLLLHRVEALVRTARLRSLDPLRAALLGQLSVEAPLDRLRVDDAVLRRWLGDLSADGLVESSGADWRLTDRGRRALDSGVYTATAEERRVFTFTEEESLNSPSRFVALHGPAVALPSPLEWRFDAAVLVECVQRPSEWKERHGFPMDVEAIVAPLGSGAGPADWRRVILDRPEQILLVFVPAAEAPPLTPTPLPPGERGRGEGWLGFAVRPEGWALQAAAPALVLSGEEEPGAEPSPEAWREAWRGWSQGRGLSAGDADACRVEPSDERVRVTAPRRLVERLGAERNEAWLLAGVGRVRVAAPMEIVEQD